MNGVATITQKGQVVIPQPIRKYLGLEPSDKLYFEAEGEKIIATPVLSVDQAMGIIKAKRYVSKKEQKRTIAKKVREKASQP